MSNNEGISFNKSGIGNVAGLNGEAQAGLVNALKNNLHNLIEDDIMGSLSPIVRKRVDELREIQSQHDELEAKFFEERAILEAKYQKLYQPLYAKRYDIVNGIAEVDGTKTEAAMEDQGEDKDAEEKGVPGFWLIAMKNNEVVAEEITKRDEEALKYLKDIKWCRVQEPKGFKLEFYFDTNPYFKNTVLTKTYHMIDEYEPILEKATATEIEWYPGKSLMQKVLKKKPNKGSENAKPSTKTEERESFFNFFYPPPVPKDDEILDEDAAEELQNQMEQDYDVGSIIRDKIIPHAVSWFTGEAIDGDLYLDDEDEDEDDGLYDDDDDYEDEDDDEEGSKTKEGLKAQGGEQQGERPAECKQQ